MDSERGNFIVWKMPYHYVLLTYLLWFSCWRTVSFVLRRCKLAVQFSDYTSETVSQAVVSASHGVVCGTVGLAIVLECGGDVIRAQTPLVGQYITLGCGYFIHDLIAMYYCHSLKLKESSKCGSFVGNASSFLKSRPSIVFHHVTMVLFFFPVLLKCEKMGNFMAGCFFIMETSSLFVNVRFILSKTQYENGRIYFANGVMMVLTFTVCRVLVFPFMYLCYLLQQSSYMKLGYLETLGRVPLVCHCSCSVLLALQVYWLSSIVKGFRSALRSSSSAHSNKVD